jgi:hypothetical protein
MLMGGDIRPTHEGTPMTWWDLFNSVAVGASILGAILGLVTWVLSARTDRLIRESHADTNRLIREVHSETLAVLDRIDERAEARHRSREEDV